MLKYDAWIPNLRPFNDLGQQANSANVSAAQTQAATIEFLCTEIQAECTGSNTQYTSNQNCIDVLSAKPFGDWDEVWQDSVVCRELHILLARVDPLVSLSLALSLSSYQQPSQIIDENELKLMGNEKQVHCPHVGPTGGSKCVNEPYEQGYFFSDQALFGKPEGQNFVCKPIPPA